MENYIVVTPLFKQRVNELGGPEDTIILSAPEGVVVKLDDVKYKSVYEPYLLGEGELVKKLVAGANKNIAVKRRNRFKNEADDLYMEWQFDLSIGSPEADDRKARWENKVKEIKAELPLLKLD